MLVSRLFHELLGQRVNPFLLNLLNPCLILDADLSDLGLLSLLEIMSKLSHELFLTVVTLQVCWGSCRIIQTVAAVSFRLLIILTLLLFLRRRLPLGVMMAIVIDIDVVLCIVWALLDLKIGLG